jgi:hypothetical protein
MFQLGLDGNLDLGDETFGLVLDIGGYFKNVITLAPSLEITREEMDQGLRALELLVALAKRDDMRHDAEKRALRETPATS